MSSVPSQSLGPTSKGTAQGLAALTPVAPNERIHALDLLRGWAMFGVLWANLNTDYGTRDPANAMDRGLAWLQYNLISARFLALLSLLFGVGFGIQLLRATERGVDVRTMYYRRSLALMAIGIVHGCLVWWGDILSGYALVAFALVVFRTASPRRILTAAILCWFVVPEIVSRAFFLAGLRYPMWSVYPPWVLAHGSWLQVAPIRVTMYLDGLSATLGAFYFWVLSLFLVGLWAVKSGYLRRVIEDPKTTRRLLFIAITAAAVGYARNLIFSKLLPSGFFLRGDDPGVPRFWIPVQLIRRLLGWSTVGTTVAFAAILLLLWQRPRIARILRPLAATGRMALTTYLTQSVVCTLLFYGYGLGWYGHVGFTGMFEITLVLFACQMAASTWWLGRFRFGPVEWLWRWLTYGRAPRMRLADEQAASTG